MHRHRTSLVHTAKKKLDDVRSDINVTPLVDVCLVLLIIFMVVADKLARGKDVPLPKTRYHASPPENDQMLFISLAKDGGRTTVYWDRDALNSVDDLKKRLNEELRRKARPMVFKADADLKYKDVYPVLIVIKDSGANNIMLATQEIKDK